MMKLLVLALLGIFLSPATQALAQASATISIERAWARATPAGARTAAAYLTIVNRGTAVDRVVGASTPVAEKLQIHQETNDNGVMRMRELSSVTVAEGASVTLKPGGTHIMMIGLKQQLKEGQSFPLTVEFQKAGRVTLQVPIAKVGAMDDHDISGK